MSGQVTRLALALLFALLLTPAPVPAVPPAGIQYVPAVPDAGGSLLLTAPPVPRAGYLPAPVERVLSEPGRFSPRDSWTLRMVGSAAILGAPAGSPGGPTAARLPPAAYDSRSLSAALGGSGGLRLLAIFAAVAAAFAALAWHRAGRRRAEPPPAAG